jgi:succinyl-CoA synthetase beta subunit
LRFGTPSEEAGHLGEQLLGRDVLGLCVDEVLVEKPVLSRQELFLAKTYDHEARAPLVLASAQGGIEVEQTAARAAASLVRRLVDMSYPFSTYTGRECPDAATDHGSL